MHTYILQSEIEKKALKQWFKIDSLHVGLSWLQKGDQYQGSLWEDFRAAFWYLNGTYKKPGEGLFKRAWSNRTEGFKRIGLYYIKGCEGVSPVRVVEH